MRRFLFFAALAALFALLALPFPAAAQSSTPEPQPVSENATGQITGVIVNRSPEGQVPGELEIMLHAWDEFNNQKAMQHGQSQPDGAFLFQEVAFEPGVYYTVMANYGEAAYFSEPVQLEVGQTSLEMEIPIYESTADMSNIRADQMHVLFFYNQGGLAVSEVYVLSNTGEYTVIGGVSLDDGTQGSIKFPLPEGAFNVDFGPENGGRFLQYSGGFMDTSPLLPGHTNSQVVVSYMLPYENGVDFVYTSPIPVQGLSFLIPEEMGLKLEGEGLMPDGNWRKSDGVDFSIYSHAGLEAGETLNLKISGEPVASAAPAAMGSEATSPYRSNTASSLGIGGAVLGLVLVGLGAWWYRRPSASPDNVEDAVPADFDQLLSEIALLDQAHQQGELPEAEYRARRETLSLKARSLLEPTETESDS